MEVKKIKELMAAMSRIGIKRLLLKDGEGLELELELNSGARRSEVSEFEEEASYSAGMQRIRGASFLHNHPTFEEVTVPSALSSGETAEKKGEADVLFVTSPMVGIFFGTPSPESPPFVKKGDIVTEESVVCIIEAMKVMNDIKAGVSGIIEEVLIENGQAVEFGSRLFRISKR